jgi:hypothetical protein
MFMRRRAGRSLIAVGLALLTSFVACEPAAATPAPSPVSFHAWNGAGLFTGSFDGVVPTVSNGRLAIGLLPGRADGSWTSPAHNVSAPINDLVASWQAKTPAGSWVQTKLQVQVAGHWSAWYTMGQWAFQNTGGFSRTSVNGQSDADGTIYTDTYVSGDNGPASAYRLRATLHGSEQAGPFIYQLAATTSALPAVPPTSATTMSRAIDLPVPAFSQMTHIGEYPRYGGGGEVWCSPTSTAMVMKYWHRGPRASELASLPPDPVFDAHGRRDSEVDWAAIHTWDTAYEGTGNWPFNTAYASHYGLDGSVRQYATLRDVEAWIKRGVPIVASIAWNNEDADPSNDLAGAALPKSGGHLMVVRGFTAAGEVLAADPAAPDNTMVRRTYQRAQFERNWLRSGSGTTYVIKPLFSFG